MAIESGPNMLLSLVLLRLFPLSLRSEFVILFIELRANEVRLPRLPRLKVEPVRCISCVKVRTTTNGRPSLPVLYSLILDVLKKRQ